MRSPVSRVAAAVIFVLAVSGVVWWFHAGGARPAYADFVKPLLAAKTARYKTTNEVIGAVGTKSTTVVMMLDASRIRSEIDDETPEQPRSQSVIIWDGYQGKTLKLEPKLKLATVTEDLDRPKDKKSEDEDLSRGWRSSFLYAQNPSDEQSEPLGEKDIDGRHVIGFRLTHHGMVTDLWGDPKTGLPVRMEETRELMPNVKLKSTMSDFELNVDLDKSLFSVEPPPGYKVTVVRKTNDGPPGEKDLITAFITYNQHGGFQFPESIDPRKMQASCTDEFGKAMMLDMCTPLDGKLDETKRRKIEELCHKSAAFRRSTIGGEEAEQGGGGQAQRAGAQVHGGVLQPCGLGQSRSGKETSEPGGEGNLRGGIYGEVHEEIPEGGIVDEADVASSGISSQMNFRRKPTRITRAKGFITGWPTSRSSGIAPRTRRSTG